MKELKKLLIRFARNIERCNEIRDSGRWVRRLCCCFKQNIVVADISKLVSVASS